MTQASPITGRAAGASAMTIAAVLMAASGFLAVIIAARVLSKPENGDFLIAWSLLFAFTGALASLQAEASRATSQVAGRQPERGASVVGGGLIMGGTAAALVLLTGAAWVPFFGVQGSPWAVLVPIALGVLAYAGQSATLGGLLGGGRRVLPATIVSIEALGRLAAFALVAGLAASVVGFLWASVLPMVLWPLVMLLAREGRHTLALRTPSSMRTLLRHGTYAVAAGACTSILVNGYPALLRVTSAEGDVPALPDAILAITLTRAPLLLPLLAFQGVVVVHLARNPRSLATVLGGLWVVTGVVAGGMAWLGPWAIRLLYGELYDVDPVTMALFTLGAGSTATLVISAAAALSRSRHRLYLAGWVVGTAASVVLLLVPLPLVSRVTLSLGVGPLVGAVLVLGSQYRPHRA